MDVNELNKMSVTALFSKLTSQPNAGSAGGAFASLLNKSSAVDLLPGASKDASQTKNDKQVALADNKTRPNDAADKSKDIAPADKSDSKKIENKKPTKADSNKPAADKTATTSVSEDISEEEDQQAATGVATPLALIAVPVAEPLAPTAEAGGVNPSEAVDSVNSAMADGAALEGAGTVGAEAVALPADSIKILDANGSPLEQNLLTPANLVKLSEIQVVDSKTGAVTQMSGAELSAKMFGQDETNVALQNAGLPVVQNLAVEAMAQAEVVAPMVAPTVAEGIKPLADVAKEAVKAAVVEDVVKAPVADGTANIVTAVAANAAGHQMKNLAPQENAQNGDVAAATDEAGLQAAELDKMLNGEQLKVDVSVKEEKIAYHSNQGLVKDRLALDKALGLAADAGSDALAPATVANTTTIAPAQVVAQPAIQPQAVAAPIVAQAAISAADDVAPKVSVAEVSALTTTAANNAAGVSGSEFVNAAKADANNKANEASFRDVYKGMSKEVVDQVKVNITKSAVKGVDTIDVHLKPEDLGRIEVKMQIKDGKLQAHIISSRPETMEALQKDAQSLEKAFNDAGFQTDENSLSFSYRDDGNNAHQNQGRDNQLRNFIGEVFETEANNELLSAEAANQNWNAEKGLNIKV